MTREEWFRARIEEWSTSPDTPEPKTYCSCCGYGYCTYDYDVAGTLAETFGCTVPVSYVQTSQYWRDQKEWEKRA